MKLHGDETYQRGFQNIDNHVKPPLRTQICFIAPVFFFAGLLLHRRGAGTGKRAPPRAPLTAARGREGGIRRGRGHL